MGEGLQRARRAALATQKSFKGKIPPIAEKEKRGKLVKIPKVEIFIQELRTHIQELNTNSNHNRIYRER